MEAAFLFKHRKKQMHTPYAGIILFRFKGTFSAYTASIHGQSASAETDTGTPGAFLLLIEKFKKIKTGGSKI